MKVRLIPWPETGHGGSHQMLSDQKTEDLSLIKLVRPAADGKLLSARRRLL
jgi:hypothetical protein